MAKYRVKVCVGEQCASKSIKSDVDPLKIARPVFIVFGGVKIDSKSVLVPLSEVDEDKAQELVDVLDDVTIEVYEIKEKKGRTAKLSEIGK